MKPTKIKNYASKVISSAKEVANKAEKIGTEMDIRFPEGKKLFEGGYTPGSLKQVGATQAAQAEAEAKFSGSTSGRENEVTPKTSAAIKAREEAARMYKGNK